MELKRPIRIFYCYAPEDQRLMNELDKQMEVLKLSKQVIVWHDGEILPGTPWKPEIYKHLDSADIILLLVSPDLIASYWLYSVAIDRAFERYRAREVRIIPIIMRPTIWENTPIGELQALPADGKAITTSRNRDQAFKNVVEGISKVVRKLYEQLIKEQQSQDKQKEEGQFMYQLALPSAAVPWLSVNESERSIVPETGVVEILTNPNVRLPIIFVLDTSEIMQGAFIDALNEGLQEFQKDVHRDIRLAHSIDIAIITFGSKGVQVVQDFVIAAYFQAPILNAGGPRPLGVALDCGLYVLRTRESFYSRHRIMFYRPWMFLITNSEPTDQWKEVADRIRKDEEAKNLRFFTIGLSDADKNFLARILVGRVVQMQGLRFIEMFRWITEARGRVLISSSRVGSQTDLPPLSDWATPIYDENWTENS